MQRGAEQEGTLLDRLERAVRPEGNVGQLAAAIAADASAGHHGGLQVQRLGDHRPGDAAADAAAMDIEVVLLRQAPSALLAAIFTRS